MKFQGATIPGLGCIQSLIEYSFAMLPESSIPYARFRVGRGLSSTYSLHCSSFWGLPFRILKMKLVKPKKGTSMETIGTGLFHCDPWNWKGLG